jgi:hypothetical protein
VGDLYAAAHLALLLLAAAALVRTIRAVLDAHDARKAVRR